MADQKKPESHAMFYILMACIGVVICSASYWLYTTYTTDSDKDRTAQLNPAPHPPKDAAKKPDVAAPSASATPAGGAPADNK